MDITGSRKSKSYQIRPPTFFLFADIRQEYRHSTGNISILPEISETSEMLDD